MGIEARVFGESISAVVTQGRYDSDQWVTSYQLEHSIGGSWRNLGTFIGNSDRDSKVQHNLNQNLLSDDAASPSPPASGWGDDGLHSDGKTSLLKLPNFEVGGATS